MSTKKAGALLFVLALLLRLSWSLAVISEQGGDFVIEAFPDARGYAQLAHYYFQGTPEGSNELYFKNLSFVRTPGQPLYLAAIFSVAGDGGTAVALCNSVLGAALVVLVFLTALVLFPGSKLVAWTAALGVTLSPTGITLAPAALSEIPFMAALWAAIYLLARGVQHKNFTSIAASGAALAAALAIRPVALFLPLLWPAVAWLMSRHLEVKGLDRKAVALSLALPLVFILGWTARNGVSYGVWTFSGITAPTLDNYLGFEAYRKVHPGLSREQARKEYFRGDEDLADWGPAPPAELYHRHMERFILLFSDHPGAVMITLYNLGKDNLLQRCTFQYEQLPSLERLWEFLEPVQKAAIGAALWVCVLSLGWLLVVRKWEVALLLGGYIIYFALLSGISNWQGSRLAYPCEPAYFILMGVFISGVAYREIARMDPRYKAAPEDAPVE